MMDRNAQVTGRFPFNFNGGNGGGPVVGGNTSGGGEGTEEGWPEGPMSAPYFLPGGPQGQFPSPPPPLPSRSTTSITKL